MIHRLVGNVESSETLNLDPTLFKVPLNMVIAGSTGSGKTHLLRNLLHQYLMPQIEYLVILSTTLKNDDYKEFHDKLEPDSHGPAIFKTDKDFQMIFDEIVESQTNILEGGKARLPQVLIIFDDIVGSNLVRFGGSIDSFATKSRHYRVSLCFLTQRISAISRSIRLNTGVFIIFSNFNYTEAEQFLEQYVPKKYKVKVREKLQYLFEQPYTFCLCNNRTTQTSKRIMLNGKQFIDFGN